jgi:hypothetical protein
MRRLVLAGLAALAVAACQDPRSPAGFRLPEGDAGRGREAFVALKCHECHRVAGDDLPAPVASPPVPVVLGGDVAHARTDGDLVTSIIHPSHRLAPGYPAELITAGTGSRMPDHADAMTVRQMIDLVAFLQSRYRVVRPAPGDGA